MGRTKRTTHALLAAVLGLGILVGLNILVSKTSWRWDATSTKRHSLAAETVAALRNLKQDVVAVAFYQPQEPDREQTASLFDLFTRESKRFSYEFVDPDRAPFRAKEYQVTQMGTVVLLSGEKQEKVLVPDEEKLANALIRVSNPRQSKAYIVSGHGELDPDGAEPQAANAFKGTLVEKGVAVASLTLAQHKDVPEDADALFVFGPRRDFLDNELASLTAYIQRGGRLFLALSAENPTNIDQWAADTLGVRRKPGYVVDPVSRFIVGDPMAPLVQDYGAHPITRDFNLMTLFPTCAALEPVKDGPGAARDVAPLGRSTNQSWLESDIDTLKQGSAQFDAKTDTPGPLWLAAVSQDRPKPPQPKEPGAPEAEPPAQKESGFRAVVFADQDWLSNKYVHMAGNMDLARNSANWLLEQEGLITVSKPKAPNQFLFLSMPQRMTLVWLPLAVLPGVAVILAVAVTLRRRRAR